MKVNNGKEKKWKKSDQTAASIVRFSFPLLLNVIGVGVGDELNARQEIKARISF